MFIGVLMWPRSRGVYRCFDVASAHRYLHVFLCGLGPEVFTGVLMWPRPIGIYMCFLCGLGPEVFTGVLMWPRSRGVYRCFNVASVQRRLQVF